MTQNTEHNVRTRGEQQTALIAIIEVGDMVDPFKRMEVAKQHILEAETRGAEEHRRKDADGYLFDNPDTGTEYLPHHPIESGECQYAENIREATSAELLSDLQAAWTSWKEDREEKEKATTNVAALEAALRTIAERADREGATIDDDECAAIARAALTREGEV
ncbi:hypothetical protein [Gluconobacter oxydans]|uniref:hypothetical protein n=1 Tax=Gluconobacter oxydans TaxID=442 RepID=UPI000785A453|nr:hypothetical protein [Gluconobacter oxydans]KXV11157.1 hypothetical protein AD932_11760 [Gluconobacter oxydans]